MKIIQRVLQLSNVFFLAVMTLLFVSLVFFNNSTFGYETSKQITYTVLIVVFMILAGYLVKRNKKLCCYMMQNEKFCLFTIIAVVALVQYYIIITATTEIGWDSGVLVRAAIRDNMNRSSNYFSMFQNNLFLLFSFRVIYRIFGSDKIWIILNLLNLAAIDIALVMTFYTMKKIRSLKWAYITLAISIATFGFFAWILVPYSDVLAMPFTITSFYSYLKYKEEESKNRRIFYGVLFVLLIFIGYLIKPTVVIVFIACSIHEGIRALNKKIKWNVMIVNMLAIVCILCLCNLAWSSFTQNQHAIKIENNKRIPYTHFMMMGLSNPGNGLYGAFNGDDAQFTYSFEGIEKKKAENTRVIKQRLNSLGIGGYLKFLSDKARWITSEGNFFWGGEGNFAAFDLTKETPVKNLMYTNGKNYKYYKYFVQGIWIVILFFVALPIVGIKSLKNEATDIWLIRLIIWGILLFLLLFEARSRYLILYLPFFCLLAGDGLQFFAKRNIVNFSIL